MRPWINVQCKPFATIQCSHIRIWFRVCFFYFFFLPFFSLHFLLFLCISLSFYSLYFFSCIFAIKCSDYFSHFWCYKLTSFISGEKISLYKMLRCNFISEVHCLPLLFVLNGSRHSTEGSKVAGSDKMTNNVVTIQQRTRHKASESAEITFLILSHNLQILFLAEPVCEREWNTHVCIAIIFILRTQWLFAIFFLFFPFVSPHSPPFLSSGIINSLFIVNAEHMNPFDVL